MGNMHAEYQTWIWTVTLPVGHDMHTMYITIINHCTKVHKHYK